MKRLLATLVPAVILLSSCNGPGGEYPELYLDDISIDLYMNSPARVRGSLAAGTSLGEALENIDTARLRSIDITCSIQDSIAIVPLLSEIFIPVDVTTSEYSGTTDIEYSQDGISWTPRYSWTTRATPARFDATAIMSNVSGRSWTMSELTMLDMDGTPVFCMPDSFTLPEGELVTGLWSAEGYRLDDALVFGWPQTAGWNHLVPFLTTGTGHLLGSLGGPPEWPLRTGDTLWIQSDRDVILTESTEQHSRGYNGTLDIENNTPAPISLRLVYPDVLPRGAEFKVQGEVGCEVTVGPGEKTRLEYTINYP